MGIWGDIGRMLGDIQSLRDDVVREIKTDSEEIKNTAIDVADDIKNSTDSAAETLKQAVDILPTDSSSQKE